MGLGVWGEDSVAEGGVLRMGGSWDGGVEGVDVGHLRGVLCGGALVGTLKDESCFKDDIAGRLIYAGG